METEEINRLIAEKVMGLVEGVDFGVWEEHVWKTVDWGDGPEIDIFAVEYGDYHNGPACVRCGYGYCHHCQLEPDEHCELEPDPYSTSPYFMQKVVDKLIKQGLVFRICINAEDIDCFIVREGQKVGYGRSDTLETAVCLAALDYMGVL